MKIYVSSSGDAQLRKNERERGQNKDETQFSTKNGNLVRNWNWYDESLLCSSQR